MWQLNRRTNKENRSQLLKILQERCEKVQQQERRLAVQVEVMGFVVGG